MLSQLFDRRYVGKSICKIEKARTMHLLRATGSSVRKEEYPVVTEVCISCGGLTAYVRHNPRDNHVFCATTPENRLQIGVIEGRIAVLGDYFLMSPWCYLSVYSALFRSLDAHLAPPPFKYSGIDSVWMVRM